MSKIAVGAQVDSLGAQRSSTQLLLLFYTIANSCDSIPRSEDKFRSVGKWAAFRKSATPESIKLVEDDFGGSEIQCMKCDAVIGNLYHDGKKSGDDHPEAKDRHCLESDALVFEPLDLDEPAPEPPTAAEPARQISLTVQETTETPVTMPAGMTQPTIAPSKSASLRSSSRASAPSSGNNALSSSSSSSSGSMRASRKAPRTDSAASPSMERSESGVSATVIGAVAVATVAVVGIAAWLGWRNSKRGK